MPLVLAKEKRRFRLTGHDMPRGAQTETAAQYQSSLSTLPSRTAGSVGIPAPEKATGLKLIIMGQSQERGAHRASNPAGQQLAHQQSTSRTADQPKRPNAVCPSSSHRYISIKLPPPTV